MTRYFLFIAVLSSLWHMSFSLHECTIPNPIIDGELTFVCPPFVNRQELRLYGFTVEQLDSITSLVVRGLNSTSLGPFTRIPPNICLLRNLQIVNFASNQITEVDPTGALTNCLSNVVTLDLQSNLISRFPTELIRSMTSLRNLYFQRNRLTDISPNAFADLSSLEIINFSSNQLTSFELWALQVKTSADFSNNQISTITNKYFYNKNFSSTYDPTIFLTNNSRTINFTDAVYAMYDHCIEVHQWLFEDPDARPPQPFFTQKLGRLDFGTTQIECNCDQAYFLGTFRASYGGNLADLPPNLPISNATCVTNSSVQYFLNSTCAPGRPGGDGNSTVDFSLVYPRLCQIFDDEEGNITSIINTTAPSLNASRYLHYETAFLQPGACFFTFLNESTMNTTCTDDVSTSSRISNDLLSSGYMSSINRVLFPERISTFPSYLCSLPSDEIDLSGQAFTALTDATFPCLDSFSTITLANNNITSVAISNGDFQNLTSLDLSSNLLTQIPYSILRPNPTSLRYLDLRNNRLTSIDLFIYTLENITINLDNNPINISVIINPQNVTLETNDTSRVNITFPSNVSSSVIVIQDTTVNDVISCTTGFISMRNFLVNFKSTFPNAVLSCTCASYGLSQLYRENERNILDELTCSRAADMSTYQNFTNTSCPNAINLLVDHCPNATQLTTDMTTTTAGSLNNSIEVTSTSFTITTTNTSALSTPNLSNHTQSTLTSTNSIEINATTATITNASSLTSTAGSLQSSGGESNASRTGLIVGLVVGLVGGFILIAALIVAILYLKHKGAGTAGKGVINRAALIGQTSGDSLSSRIPSRSIRNAKLPPIPTKATSALPDVPVKTYIAPPSSSLLSNPSATVRTSAKGIPVRLEPIRTPSEVNPQYPLNSNALNNSSNVRATTNNLPTQQPPLPRQPVQPPKPRTNQMLNIGGNLRY